MRFESVMLEDTVTGKEKDKQMEYREDGYLERFDPVRDDNDWVSEESDVYARRMQSSFLPEWPAEVLKEWLYRHQRCISKYAFLGYERFRFKLETWPLSKIPDRRAFDDESFCDNFVDIECRAEEPADWLAQYMLRHGTWNTPIIVLDNPGRKHVFPDGRPLKSPYHLLEGHRRLSFLNGLRKIDRALAEHDVWLVRL